MKKVDYIIIGLGLAGIAFCEQLEESGKTFVVFDSGIDGASRVAAGLYNPVILKRYTLPWKAIEQFDLAIPYYKKLERKLGVSFVKPMPVCKVFSSAEDQNNWFSASDKPSLERFVSPKILPNTNQFVKAPNDFGEVLETGRVAINTLLKAYRNYLEKKQVFENSKFIYSNITFRENFVIYGDYGASKIVFAEGYGIKENPYFSTLPLVGNKGEYIIIKAPDLQLNAAIKSSFFIVPLGEDMYKVGATFNWTDKDSVPSKEAREELVEKLLSIQLDQLNLGSNKNLNREESEERRGGGRGRGRSGGRSGRGGRRREYGGKGRSGGSKSHRKGKGKGKSSDSKGKKSGGKKYGGKKKKY